MKEIPKAYNPRDFEDKIYHNWEKGGFFNPDKLSASVRGKKGEPYSIMMPPPNVTGVLHLGHALENSLMDTMARYQRLRGKMVLLLPGTDHAAVATQAKVEKVLVAQGIKNPRQELGREKLLEKIREYAENSKTIILKQIRKMGTSCDWSRLAYTFDADRSRAVNEVFKKMYENGLIYRGFRAVNWSVKGQSTCSDEELVYIEREAKFYTFKYGKSFPFTIATTRPETKLGDTAVAVNPKDKRYKKYIGKEFKVDFLGQELVLKIIGDSGVEMGFGTGALGVTPAHSLVDYEMAQKNNLPIIKVIGEDGKMTREAGRFAGMGVLEAREKIVEELKKQGLLEKEEDITQSVGTSDRFGDIVEVLPMTQWFVAVNKKIPGRGKTLKDLMKEAVGPKGIKITPARFQKIYFNWIDNLRDWCISRQIWWGHRIPVWYRQVITNDELQITSKKGAAKPNIYVGDKPPTEKGWTQDPDTLDTWFSSGLWTFSTLGWPNSAKASQSKPAKTGDLKTFHPTSWMQMGHEILFFWMARMILMSEYVLKEIPFKNVYIHGILRDEKGQKFSKSAGNSVDPLEVTEKYGTDALRFALLSGVSPGQDQRFYFEKMEGARNLVNKIWNISRFISTQKNAKSGVKTLADHWILAELNNLIARVTKDFENYDFSQAAEKLREFTWSDFADWYLEISKIEGRSSKSSPSGKEKILKEILEKLLILWHPFIPFVTEAIWNEMLGKKNLIVAKWPRSKASRSTPKTFGKIRDLVVRIRNLRAENKIEPGKIINLEIVSKDERLFSGNSAIIEGLSKSKVQFKKSKLMAPQINILVDDLDRDKNKMRFEKELAEKEKYAESLKRKLENKDFVARAPKQVVDAEREKLIKVEDEIKNLGEQLKNL